jgi:hypothetical protein
MLEYLKMDQLQPFNLYRIEARNAAYGIWLPEQKGFAISRNKFGDNFVFVEYHWDCEAFATARPIRVIEKSPFTAENFKDGGSDPEILAYLNKFEGTAEERTAKGSR